MRISNINHLFQTKDLFPANALFCITNWNGTLKFKIRLSLQSQGNILRGLPNIYQNVSVTVPSDNLKHKTNFHSLALPLA